MMNFVIFYKENEYSVKWKSEFIYATSIEEAEKFMKKFMRRDRLKIARLKKIEYGEKDIKIFYEKDGKYEEVEEV